MGCRGAPQEAVQLPVPQPPAKPSWSLPYNPHCRNALAPRPGVWVSSLSAPHCVPDPGPSVALDEQGASLPAPSFRGSPSHCLDSALLAVPIMLRSAGSFPVWGLTATRTPRPSPRAARTCPYPRMATAPLHNSPTSSLVPPRGNNKVSLVEAASAGSREGRPRRRAAFFK